MHWTTTWIALCAAALVGRGAPAAAQRTGARPPAPIASTAQYVPLDSRAADPRTEQALTIDLTRATIADALDEIGRRAGVRVLYGEDVLRTTRRVTVHLDDAPLGRVLATVLRDTGLEPLISEDGASVLVKRAAHKAAPADGAIHGHVTDATSHAPVGGVLVTIVGTPLRTQTNDAGEYLFAHVPAGTVRVHVARIGYAPAEAQVVVTDGATTTADFALQQTAVALDQVVVTATGEQRSKEIATSLSTIGAEDFQHAPVSNPQDVLVGRAAGVTVIANGGAPGAGGTIRLRGVNSITQGNSPIIYVDGVRMYSDLVPAGYGGRQGYLPLNDISAADIDHVEIVKGAAATTLYGTEASGGVIQIFTKRGATGRATWNFGATGGLNHMGHIGPSSDPTGLFINQCRGPNLVNSEGDPFVDVGCPASGTYLHDGRLQRYTASVAGGTDQMSYFTSANYSDESGVLPTSWSKDGGFRGNFGFRPTDKLQITVNTAYEKRKTRWAADGDNSEGLMLNASRADAGYMVGVGRCAEYTGPATCVDNSAVFTDQLFTNVDHVTGGVTLRHDATAQLSNRLTVGFDLNSNIHDTGIPWGYPEPGLELGYLWHEDRRHTKLSLDYVGSFRSDIRPSLTSAFSWGGQLFRDYDRWTEVDVSNFAGPGTPTLVNGGVAEVYGDNVLSVVNAGFFAQEVVGWRDRLFVTGGIRVDGNSAFGDRFGLQAYPKISASYVLSSHAFWPKWWETMKLRAAIGESGKAPGAFDAVRTWTTTPADSGHTGFLPAQIGNADLGPERTREIEVGFDASAFAGRVTLEASAFRARTYDALVGFALPPSKWTGGTQLVNAGTLENRGIEAQLAVGLLRTPSVDWTARVNLSLLGSKAIDLHGEEIDTYFGTSVREGYAIPTYFGERVTNPDAIADPIIEEDQPLGRQYPNRIIGLGTTVMLAQRLVLDAVGEAQYGGHLVNYTGYQNERRGAWVPCYDVQRKLAAAEEGDATALDGVTAFQRAQCSQDPSVRSADFWVQPTDFFKLRSVSLTYNLPARWIRGASAASITLAGRNLFTWTRYGGTDPEVQDVTDAGINALGRRDYYNLPNYKTFELSARITY
ncbi:MAG: TonB-dependent receptor plug domain-containing protein [Gemmatimonadaceae bacterium]|nr:TonB-dependent receptor plug domain-containing protein [Gemmatimonadaceae bacterium]